MSLIVTPGRYGAQLRHHAEQQRLIRSRVRFRVVHSGRRSGKTEIAKRTGVRRALSETKLPNAWIVFAAPTSDQAKRIFWADLKSMVPKRFVERTYEGQMTIQLKNGAEIAVLGLDTPERIEGRPLDWICIDEFANTRPKLWAENVRPALSTIGRPGEAWLIGVPEGQNHMHRLYKDALKEKAKALVEARLPEWDVFHWNSEDILDPSEIASARGGNDALSYAQEYGGQFVAYEGLAYWPFSRAKHASRAWGYQPGKPLGFHFDFNMAPGVAAVAQERTVLEGRPEKLAESFDNWIGEVWIPRNSNTIAVCRKLIADWGPNGSRAKHVGDVIVDGDATGGSGGSAKVEGSDWEIVRKMLKPVPGWNFKTRVPDANPFERVRVNAMNSRLEAMDGTIAAQFDPVHCEYLIEDFEGVMLLAGGSGELDKDSKRFAERTHITDAASYHVVRAHPLQGEHKIRVSSRG